MSFVYFKNPETSEIFAYDQQQIDDGWVETGLVPLTDEEVALHLNPPVTQEQLIADAEQERERLLAYADAVILDWRTELMLGEISDANRGKLSAWLAYKNEVKTWDIKTDPENVNWPVPPVV